MARVVVSAERDRGDDGTGDEEDDIPVDPSRAER
jgi:hypothetical protein